MALSSPKLEWCNIRLGEDMNWWVKEVSDEVHWDVDSLCIIDPKQIAHIIEQMEALLDYGLDQTTFERAFIPFTIAGDNGDGTIRVERSMETIVDAEEVLFALPDILDEENGPYADFIIHLLRIRIALLNDMIDFEQNLTIDEVEDDIKEEQNNFFIEGKAYHLFKEINTILEYVPAGWELDEDEATSLEEDVPDIPEIEEDVEETKKLEKEEKLSWDGEEETKSEEEEEKDDTYQGGPPDADDEDLDFNEKDDDEIEED